MRLYLAFFALGVLFATIVASVWLFVAWDRAAWDAAHPPLAVCTLIAVAAMTVAEHCTGRKP